MLQHTPPPRRFALCPLPQGEGGNMLSRVADSLYWMSRYIERAEHTARLIAVKLESMVEQTPEDAAASWARVTQSLTGIKAAPLHLDPFATTRHLAFDRDNDNSLIT